MKLLTKEIEKKLPPLSTNDNKKPEDIQIIIKFFHAYSNWTWYAIEGEREGDDFVFYGYVRGCENELGHFSLSELEEIRIKGIGIERDMYFGKHSLAEAMAKRL
ncbi:unnamed protein product [marine sediment metagenome]|uniref:DUF2958 domain-containing protein n=1 Tax=marine sediment metagenome TaxID=412755 RepID=X1FQQ4_9ZZZZ